MAALKGERIKKWELATVELLSAIFEMPEGAHPARYVDDDLPHIIVTNADGLRIARVEVIITALEDFNDF